MRTEFRSVSECELSLGQFQNGTEFMSVSECELRIGQSEGNKLRIGQFQNTTLSCFGEFYSFSTIRRLRTRQSEFRRLKMVTALAPTAFEPGGEGVAGPAARAASRRIRSDYQ